MEAAKEHLTPVSERIRRERYVREQLRIIDDQIHGRSPYRGTRR